MNCTQCGNELQEEGRFCAVCGAPKVTQEPLIEVDPPLTTMQYFICLVCFFIPVVNVFCSVWWSFAKGVNENRRTLARAGLLFSFMQLIITALILIGVIVAVSQGKVPVRGFV